MVPEENPATPAESGSEAPEAVHKEPPVSGATEPEPRDSATGLPELKDGAWRRKLGVIATLAWLAVFAAGLLIPSEKSREILGWKPNQAEDNRIKEIEFRISKLEKGKDDNSESRLVAKNDVGAPVQKGVDESDADDPQETKEVAKQLETLDNKVDELLRMPGTTGVRDGNRIAAFLVAAISFVPINVAILCILAGCIGACCVSEEFVRDVRIQAKAMADTTEGGELTRKLNFLTEHPIHSALRGLVVYLLISSGLFVFAGSQPLVDPANQASALAGYIKFAGIFSFFSYLAGHDPTVFTNMIRFGGGKLPANSSGSGANGN